MEKKTKDDLKTRQLMVTYCNGLVESFHDKELVFGNQKGLIQIITSSKAVFIPLVQIARMEVQEVVLQ